MHDVSRAPERALLLAVVLNAAFLVVELVIGFWSGSLALLSDAGHMVSDVGALAVALVAQRMARVRPGTAYTFGLQRLPVLGGLVNGVTLVAVVVLILREAIERFQDPPPVLAMPVLIAGIVGMAINGVSALVLRRSGGRSINIRAAMLHLVTDMFGSMVAVISALVVLATGWMAVDPILSLVIAALIVVSSWPLLHEAIRILLQRAPRDIDLASVRMAMLAEPDVFGVSDLHLWELDSGQYVLSAIVLVNCDEPITEAVRRCDRMKERLAEQFGIEHATLEWRTAENGMKEHPCPAHELPLGLGLAHSHHD